MFVTGVAAWQTGARAFASGKNTLTGLGLRLSRAATKEPDLASAAIGRAGTGDNGLHVYCLFSVVAYTRGHLMIIRVELVPQNCRE
jgi:hypothetical protein